MRAALVRPLAWGLAAVVALGAGAYTWKEYGDHAALEACYREYALARESHAWLEDARIDSVRFERPARGVRAVRGWLSAPAGRGGFRCTAVQDRGLFGWSGREMRLSAPDDGGAP